MIAKLGFGVGCFSLLGLVGMAWQQAPKERIVASYATSLEGRTFSQRHNALLALRALDGQSIPAHETLSFNQKVGSFSRDQGYRKAPVSYNGQLIDDWGGGVCQASTTLYNAGLMSGLTVLERNHHRFCPSYVPPGRDAAVAYPSLDLKLANPYDFPVRLHAFIDVDKVRVDILASQPLPERVAVETRLSHKSSPTTFYLGTRGAGGSRVRNSGKPGYSSAVYRTIGTHEELVSEDSYPTMNRVVEFR